MNILLLKPKNFLELGIQYGETTKNIIDLILEDYVAVDITKDDNILSFIMSIMEELVMVDNFLINLEFIIVG